jgi:NADPH-dependent 2,4-dienoyl-CoA reductase/sulfur reductase-like enzyme
MTRALIADPDLVRKVELGQRDRVRPCVGSNQGCQDRITQKLPITCFHNPDVGREATMALIASPHPRDVLVVGAGPAGLKAAEIAARRGHRVQVVDRAPRIGGRLRVVEALPGASELLGSVRWVERELRELGVDVQLGVEADEALVDALGPEVVVVATGASPDPAALLREADRPGVPLISADEAMTAPLADARVLVVDQLGGFEAAFAAERLALAGARVAVCTPYPSPGQFMGMTSAVAHIEVLARHGCDVHAHSMFRGIDGSEATVHHELTGRTTVVEVDAVVTLPNVALAEALRGTDRDVLLAGDVVAPRTAMHAFREGDAVARLI